MTEQELKRYLDIDESELEEFSDEDIEEDFGIEDDWETEPPKKIANIISEQNRKILVNVFGDGFDEVEPLEQVGKTPFFYGSLGIAYGVEGSGKSWQLAKLLGTKTEDSVLVVYLDTDGANGKKFSEHCKNNKTSYVDFNKLKGIPLSNGKMLSQSSMRKKSRLKLVELFISAIARRLKKTKKKLVVVVDSLSSIGEGQAINQAQDISPVLYKLDLLGQDTGASIIVIDHTTVKLDDNGDMTSFKLEGNAGAKRRTTTSTVRYEPKHTDSPQDGGVFTVERSRDTDCFAIGDEYKVLG